MATVKCPQCGAVFKVSEKKTGLWWGIGCVVAALVATYFVAIVGLLAAIAIPSFVKARDTAQYRLCATNMQMLAVAKEEAVRQHGYQDGDIVSAQDVSPYLKNGFAGLVCPKDGHYTISPVGQAPACSVHGPLPGAVAARKRPAAQAPEPIDAEPPPD